MVVLTAGLWCAAPVGRANAAAVEYLQVPSAAMGRDIPVAFQFGGPHAVYLLADNNTRVWVFSPQTTACSDPAAMIGYCDQAQGSNRSFFTQYHSVKGDNGHFDLSVGGQHDWGTWAPQLVVMSGDIATTIK